MCGKHPEGQMPENKSLLVESTAMEKDMEWFCYNFDIDSRSIVFKSPFDW